MMRSVTDSKSSEGGMEYLPLMGKNSMLLDTDDNSHTDMS